LKTFIRALPILGLVGCSATPSGGIAEAQHRYLMAKASCDRDHASSLAPRADCRTHAANAFIRPYYRYGDLMTYVQEKRKALAVKVDHHEMSHRNYDRQMAEAEQEVSREEDRRNRIGHTASSYESTPFTPVTATFARLFN
jgi:hypothetical protein